jgi:DnaK suppressor protein
MSIGKHRSESESGRAIEARLIRELESLSAALESRSDDGAVELDQTRIGRVSRIDAIQQQQMSQGLRERMQRQRIRIEAALRRLQDGSYGSCCSCGEDITPARLEADPSAPFCTECQQAIDGRRGAGA